MSRSKRRASVSAASAPAHAGGGQAVRWRAAAVVAVAGTTFLAYLGVLDHAFLNWDDPDVLVRNPRLDGPGVVGWAFSTTHVSHYQPLSWLAWAALRRAFGPDASPHHLASLLAHALNAALVSLLAWRLPPPAVPTAPRTIGAVSAGLVFAVHPLRVEPVAWASGLPYLLALGPLLLATLAYLSYARGAPPRPIRLLGAGVGYLASLLFRPVARGFPLALLVLDAHVGRLGPLGRGWKRPVLEKLPFAALGLAAAAAEASARPLVGLDRIGVGVRVADAALAPFVYLARTVAPVGLSPLDPLPLDARTSWPALAGGLLLLVATTAVLVRQRDRRPGLLFAWLAWLSLLAPALGLAPSGLQATADRYTYVPGVVLALVAGSLAGALWRSRRRRPALALAAAIGVALAAATARQLAYWRDSVTLWTRAVEIDPGNDVALYNLASALAEKGRDEAASARYQELLRLIPDHAPARRNLALLEAKTLEEEAGRAAATGRLGQAVELYARALERDPARLHARASRGMALVELGRFVEALPDLQQAVRGGRSEPALWSALGVALVEAGRPAEARRALEEAVTRFPGDLGLAHNLARLLATAGDPSVRDAPRAVRLAESVVARTDGRDPRALDTLAAAQAGAGRPDLAAQAAARAVIEARRQGRHDLAALLAARARAYRSAPR